MVFYLCKNQVITGMDGRPIDINIVALERTMDVYEIDDRKDCLEKVLAVFRHFFINERFDFDE